MTSTSTPPAEALEFFQRFVAQLKAHYPEAAAKYDFGARLSPNLVSFRTLELPSSLADQAHEIVRAFSALRELEDRDTKLSSESPAVTDGGNYSALMSYDFHVDENRNLRLIEINTNASLGLIMDVAHETQQIPNRFSPDFKKTIVETFISELKLSGGTKLGGVAIVDENPAEQRLYAEFLLYKELFERAGAKAVIADPRDLKVTGGKLMAGEQTIDLVYNRHTDFYFTSPECAPLREAMEKKLACLSPHPHEYRLLADKERLLELSQAGAVEALPLSDEDKRVLRRALIRTLDVTKVADTESLWRERKKLFFKPMRSFGGKAAYRGQSVSHSVFDQIVKGEYVAQDYVPAPTVKFGPTAEDEFKYDLRFFVYRDQIQLACARLYRGQMTNSQTLGGGASVIVWK